MPKGPIQGIDIIGIHLFTATLPHSLREPGQSECEFIGACYPAAHIPAQSLLR
jgi:hypothetical protein